MKCALVIHDWLKQRFPACEAYQVHLHGHAESVTTDRADGRRPLTLRPVLYRLSVQAFGAPMATKTSYSHARENLASLWDEVENSREAAIIQRRGHEDMALVPADELASLRETAYLLRSPENAVRLLAALTRARRGRKRATDLPTLRRELGATL